MSDNNISLDPDQALASVTKLVDSQDAAATVAAQVEGHGSWTGPGFGFRWDVAQYVADIQQKMNSLSEALAELETAITTTVSEMGQQDEALAGQSAQFTVAVATAAATDTVMDSAAAFQSPLSNASVTKG